MRIIKNIINMLKNNDHEGISYPWWMIVDPSQNMRCDPHQVMCGVTGPFFSRQDAEEFLKRTRYNFSKRAVVYCQSGCYSDKWVRLYREVVNN